MNHLSRTLRVFAPLALALVVAGAHAQDAANQASVKLGGRQTIFKKVAAVRAKSDSDVRVLMIATGQPLSAETIRKVKAKDAADSIDSELDQPYLKAVFQEDGTLLSLTAQTGNSMFMESGGPDDGKATIADGRIRGSVKFVRTGNFAKDVAFQFDVPIDAPIAAPGPVKLNPPVKPTVSGKFLGNGKPAALKFVSVLEEENFSDKPAVAILFTEKDHSSAKKPKIEAVFGKFGSALLLSVHHDGGIFGCEVKHSAHSKSPFSSLGKIHMVEFEIEGGNVTGHVSTGGEIEFFDQKWETDLKFAAPLPEKLRNATSMAPKPAADEPPAPKKMTKAPAGPAIAASSLPLPSDASNVEFKALVKQIHCASARPVEPVAKELSAKLKEQGWKDGAGSLMGKKNAILKRERGDAKLTIMIQPNDAGSVVKIFADRLDWTDAPASSGAAKPAKASDLEGQANKALEDALKLIPKGF